MTSFLHSLIKKKSPGDHDLFVYWSNEPVPGSPFLVHVEESLPPSAMIKTTGGRFVSSFVCLFLYFCSCLPLFVCSSVFF